MMKKIFLICALCVAMPGVAAKKESEKSDGPIAIFQSHVKKAKYGMYISDIIGDAAFTMALRASTDEERKKWHALALVANAFETVTGVGAAASEGCSAYLEEGRDKVIPMLGSAYYGNNAFDAGEATKAAHDMLKNPRVMRSWYTSKSPFEKRNMAQQRLKYLAAWAFIFSTVVWASQGGKKKKDGLVEGVGANLWLVSSVAKIILKRLLPDAKIGEEVAYMQQAMNNRPRWH
jgi:hypothetical protein